MTLSGMTPGEGWRLLEPGETIQEGDEIYEWDHDKSVWYPIDKRLYGDCHRDDDDDPIRRRLDLTPLMEEMREASVLFAQILKSSALLHTPALTRMGVDAWLTRNAAFGLGKGEKV